jgi:hypothetical protein
MKQATKGGNMDLQDAVTLKKAYIDDETERNPSLVAHFAQELASAKAEKDRLDVLLKHTKAEKDLYYRANPLAGVKATESSISSMVTTDKEVQKVEKELLEAKEELYAYESAVKAMEDKSTMIKVLKDLMINGIVRS